MTGLPSNAVPKPPIAYLAGLFDGEGSVTIQRRSRKDRANVSYVGRLAMANAHEGVVRAMQRQFGGSIHSSGRSSVGQRYKLFEWVVSGKIAYDAAKLLAEHTLIKQRELENLVEFYDRVDSFGRMARTAGRHGHAEQATALMLRSNEIAASYITRSRELREEVRTRI